MKSCHGDVTESDRTVYVWSRDTYLAAQALYTKGHLTSIAGGDHRPIQLNLLAVSVCRSDRRVWWCDCSQTPDDLKPTNEDLRGRSTELWETTVSVENLFYRK